MKFATLAALVASASAFAPAQQSARSSVALNAERSKSLPFMNRPSLVSRSSDFPLAARWEELSFFATFFRPHLFCHRFSNVAHVYPLFLNVA